MEMLQPVLFTLWEGFLPCHSKPCYARWPHPCPDHHAHSCGLALSTVAMPSTLLSLQHRGQQPQHWSGPSLCLELGEWDPKAGSPQAVCRATTSLQTCSQGESRDSFQPAAPRTHGQLPQPWSLLAPKQTYFPLLLQGEPTTICPVQRTHAGDQKAMFHGYFHLLSDPLYHTQERSQVWAPKALLYQAEVAQSQGPASLLDTSRNHHRGDQGPHSTCVYTYRPRAPPPDATATTSEGKLAAGQWVRNTSTHGCYHLVGLILDKRLQEMLQF